MTLLRTSEKSHVSLWFCTFKTALETSSLSVYLKPQDMGREPCVRAHACGLRKPGCRAWLCHSPALGELLIPHHRASTSSARNFLNCTVQSMNKLPSNLSYKQIIIIPNRVINKHFSKKTKFMVKTQCVHEKNSILVGKQACVLSGVTCRWQHIGIAVKVTRNMRSPWWKNRTPYRS